MKLEHEFDGIDMSKYDRFWEKWRLLTVRYRKDNNEQRFVYANDIACGEAVKWDRPNASVKTAK